MGATDIKGIIERLEEMLLKLSDGTVDPGDIEFIDETLERVREFLDQGLQSIIDGHADDIALALALISSIKTLLIIMSLRGK